ncbi:hypothetical protein DPMN_074953 [Dreissena polymorpha]|uniref:Uncharacterized protein n=1 Tax=Dreissena polymorpha TaxID=45954 RepID=A0A9D4BEH3_DREPO|nr:hypothetical protein DPMN_074953 [Dreissena polymorpha]
MDIGHTGPPAENARLPYDMAFDPQDTPCQNQHLPATAPTPVAPKSPTVAPPQSVPQQRVQRNHLQLRCQLPYRPDVHQEHVNLQFGLRITDHKNPQRVGQFDPP